MGLLIKILIGGIIAYLILWFLFHNEQTGVILLLVVALGLQYPAIHLTGYILAAMELGDFVERHKIIGYFIVTTIWGLVCLVLYGITAWLLMKLFF